MYERNYQKTVLKTESQPVKKTGRINWRWVLVVILVGIVIAGSIYLIRLPRLQVSHIEVSGVNVVDPGDVTEFIHNDLQGRRMFILPKSSIFLVPIHTLEKELKIQFSRFQTVSVSRKNFSTLSVAVTEYQGIYLWCVDAMTCYAMDQNGVAFAPAASF
jgi:cell division septal protein FtsQ